MQLAEIESQPAATTGGAEPSKPAPNKRWHQVFVFVAGLLLAFSVLVALRPLVVQTPVGGDHYVYLARHIVRGDLTVDDLPNWYGDYAEWGGHEYLPFGLLPALLLIPLLPLLNMGFALISVSQAFNLLNVFLFYRVLGLAGVRGERRNWALLLFFGGTVYLSTVVDGSSGNSWLFAHVITTSCLLLAIGEVLGKKRPVLIGLFVGLAVMTRFTTIFALPFFAWLLWREQPDSTRMVGSQEAAMTRRLSAMALRLGLVAVGLIGPLVVVGLYNYLRFGSPLESGYGMALLYYPVLDQARNYGLFSIAHVPKNLFMLLLQGPKPYPSEDAPVLMFPFAVPSPWGMGIFFTSPALLYAFRARLREPLVQACWLAVLCVMLPLVTYYGIGWVQFGYRYALDFLPFLLILAALGFKEPLSNRARALVLASVLVCLWGTILIGYRLGFQ